ncbi:MAG: hypothetical protein HZC02_02625 [Candidatus Levybacteria bacterium]|nr:hypothetical protein [Candidatus Levybacteria bacterium]
MSEIRISGSRPDGYTGFTSLKNDHEGNISQNRLSILQGGRKQLTSEQAQNPLFVAHLKKAHAESIPQQNSLSPFTADKLSQIKSRLPFLSERVLGEKLSDEELEELNLPEISDIFFNYANVIAPMYLGFAKEIAAFGHEIHDQDPNRDVMFLFDGRDSFPFMLGFNQLINTSTTTPDWMQVRYAPFNRLMFRRFFGAEESRPEFIEDLENFYDREDLSDNNVVAVDFGFIGSLERITQIVLDPDKRPASINHMLFSTFKKTTPPWFLASLEQMGYDIKQDAKHTEHHIQGYSNRLQARNHDEELQNILTGDNPTGVDWRPHLNHFLLFLQELGAGLNESREDSLHKRDERAYRGTHLKFASLQQMAGLYAFLEGLYVHLKEKNIDSIDDQAVTSSIKNAYQVFKANQPFFDQFIPQEDRRHIEGVEQSPAFGEVSLALAELNTLPISTVKFTKDRV